MHRKRESVLQSSCPSFQHKLQRDFDVAGLEVFRRQGVQRPHWMSDKATLWCRLGRLAGLDTFFQDSHRLSNSTVNAMPVEVSCSFASLAVDLKTHGTWNRLFEVGIFSFLAFEVESSSEILTGCDPLTFIFPSCKRRRAASAGFLGGTQSTPVVVQCLVFGPSAPANASTWGFAAMVWSPTSLSA